MLKQVQIKGQNYNFHELECPDCGSMMRLRHGQYGVFYSCVEYPNCRGIHSAHKTGDPMGKPADKETRIARMEAHRKFDSIWKYSKMSRTEAYEWMQEQMGMTKDEAHIGNFDKDQCEKLIVLVKEREKKFKKDKKESRKFLRLGQLWEKKCK
ncbi:hypothetical protein MASR1M48_16950 [Lactococcus petauri]